MPVDPLLGLGIYVICWWVCLFAILPIGVRGVHEQANAPEGHDPGAPQAPNLKQKALWTTLAAAALWLVVVGLILWDPTGIRAAGLASG